MVAGGQRVMEGAGGAPSDRRLLLGTNFTGSQVTLRATKGSELASGAAARMLPVCAVLPPVSWRHCPFFMDKADRQSDMPLPLPIT